MKTSLILFVLGIVLFLLAYHRNKEHKQHLSQENTEQKALPNPTSFTSVLCHMAIGITTGLLAILLLLRLFYENFDGFILILPFITAASSFILLFLLGIYIYGFVRSLTTTKLPYRHFLYLYAANLMMLAVIFIPSYTINQECNAPIMEQHYHWFGSNMQALIKDVRRELPPKTELSVEFRRFGTIDRLHLKGRQNINYYNFDEDGDILKSPRLKAAGIRPEWFGTLFQRLKSMGCIGISIDNTEKKSVTFNFRRIGMGMYSYTLYDAPLNDNQLQEIQSDITQIAFSRHVVFQYDGGAIGEQTFIGKEDYEKQHALSN